MNSPTTLLLIAAIYVFALSSCSDSGPAGPEFVVREVPKSHRSFKIAESSTQRFRYQTRTSAESPGSSSEKQSGPRLVYTTPDGWQEKPASMMRDINFTFGDAGEGECYVSRLPGAGGGLVANVNRWRKQMGAEPLSEEEIQALPKKPLFGQPATYLSVDGEFSGMGSAEKKTDHRLLGLILSSDAGAVFVKMTGPKALVEENAKAFDEFTQSIDVSTGGSGS